MASLYILIPIAIVFVCIAVAIFLWAVKSEQFEDLERQGYNILFDENEPDAKSTVQDQTSDHKADDRITKTNDTGTPS
ncbi:cbb3-type cytochrome oxidase assembly protein CcoS [Photobacterium sp.]|uniref:cbb3-type cytochrome oxidase assembly protein CcoS n=1 Tax=Photobacterium sp. TaxID=660 RepID=UPI00299D363D|nr:cbb3-type cytochrome oxidase assembly protein CcoS [Photobacterium sp.]MDX1301765.1 cbb3-type cytochrome oxidase assembly protein CcoS [Photobacterium sp.]